MRKLRTKSSLRADGWAEARIRRECRQRKITPIVRGVFGEGDAKPSALDVGRATALVTSGVAFGLVAGELHGFDSVRCGAPEVFILKGASNKRAGLTRVAALPAFTEAGGVRCTDGPSTLWELAHRLDDVVFEQVLESALRKDLVALDDLVEMAATKTEAGARLRRMLTFRDGLITPPTESLLETLAVQLLRKEPSIPVPTRQFEVVDEHGQFVGRPDLSWPALGVFLELDGQQHKDQPVYDARRQTRITAVTGWRCGRLTWDEVKHFPVPTLRTLAQLVRPL